MDVCIGVHCDGVGNQHVRAFPPKKRVCSTKSEPIGSRKRSAGAGSATPPEGPIKTTREVRNFPGCARMAGRLEL